MKKKIYLAWWGDGPQSSDPGSSAIVEVDLADLLDDADPERHNEIEIALQAFAEALKDELDADQWETEQTIAEENSEAAHHGKMLDGSESPEEIADEQRRIAG